MTKISVKCVFGSALMAISVLCMLLVGCTQQAKEYVCADGLVVSNPRYCGDSSSTGGSYENAPSGQSGTISGCAYDNPPCDSDYECINNVCVKKEGCLYSNPPCASDSDCINNQCLLKNGCSYDNPPCGQDYKCVNNDCVEKTICGKFGCQEGESSSNCCMDCGCPTGEECENNKCIALKPNLELSQVKSNRYSITLFMSNPSLTVGEIGLENSGNDDAKNVVVTLSSKAGYFEDQTISFGSISGGKDKTKEYSLTFTQKGLDLIAEENDLVVDADITYENSANQEFTGADDFEIMVYGKNSVVGPHNEDSRYFFSAWVTPNQNAVREFAAKSTSGLAAKLYETDKHLAAKWLFESMRAYGVQYVNDRNQVGDYVQFPMETLKRKTGDCEDQAVLYATLLESIGVDTAVIFVPGHAFAGYFIDEDTIVPVETTSSNFDSALASGLYEYEKYSDDGTLILVRPNGLWAQYPQVIHEEEPDIPLMDIKKEILIDCETKFDFTYGFYYSGTVRFQNNGDAPGAGCASMITYQNGDVRDEDYQCWTVLAGETIERELINDFEFNEAASCYIG